jgi:hypothetical protein
MPSGQRRVASKLAPVSGRLFKLDKMAGQPLETEVMNLKPSPFRPGPNSLRQETTSATADQFSKPRGHRDCTFCALTGIAAAH